MGNRYVIAKESVFADCWVTPEAYEGVFERLEQLVDCSVGKMSSAGDD